MYNLTIFLISSMKGCKTASIPYMEIKLDLTRATRYILDSFDLYFGERLPRVK